MISGMFKPMLSGMFPGSSKYAGVEFTPELIKLLVLGRLKRAYERTKI
ncbi:hypothetical protein [Roseovarius Plymouth podovirus 1]|uniref:Uncharacterized protein n=2 Tax=Roseovarius Plymouth podovirus 1 TaxID=926474 RepID=K4Q4Y7_9CAUD|nr:hypothetical protein HYO70_gp46 [Roseovarius Plymouth podovirus 1]CBW47039.1 hypothetical protein [Roseovarius sp. 217 phage 1]CBX87976.1 hypothetical protein [Roseovarius Plymouth podovirus 1]